MELVTGRFHPDLERAFSETLARLKSAEPLAPVAVVASSRRLAERLKEVALEARPAGVAGLHVHNLFSFARGIYEEAAPPGWRLLFENIALERLLNGIVRERFAKERYLPRALFSRRAIASLLGVLHELKDAAVRPGDVLDAVAAGELGLEESEKLAEILSLYKLYSDKLSKEKIHERSDVARVAAEAASGSKWLGRFRHVLYYGFYDLVQTQVDLLKAVARRVDTTVFIPRLEGHPYGQGLLELLAAAPRTLPSEPRRAETALLSASGAHGEVWAAAKQILKWSDEGVPLHRIGVVARALDPYSDLIDLVFRENRIPFSSSASRSQEREPLLKAARQLLGGTDFARGEVMDLILSPHFARPEGAEPELWDMASRFMGIGGGSREWRNRLGKRAGTDYTYSEGERGDEKKFSLPREQVDLFWDTVRRLLETHGPRERVRTFLRPLDRGTLFAELDADLESLEALAGPADPETVLRAVASLSAPVGEPNIRGVQVLDAMQARGIPFERLIVLGLNERVFPRYILEDPFLRDAVRSRLEHRLGCRMARKLDGYEEERLLFALLLGSAPHALLVFQRSDEKGRIQVPSVFLREMRPATVLPRRPSERLGREDLPRLTPLEAALRTGAAEDLARAFGRDTRLLDRAGAFLHATSAYDRLTPYDGLVDARAYWERLAGFGLSPTSLERMAECPFRYYASRVLDLEELEEPETEESLTPIEIGSLYHDVLEQFVRKNEKDLEKELKAGFRRFEKTRTIRYPLLWESEKTRIRKVLTRFVEADRATRGGLQPAEAELKLSASLRVGGREVVFRGFLDRLDLSKTAFRVIDYKRRKSSRYPGKLETGILKHGRHLQPPIYTLLALEKHKGLEGTFAYYFVEDALEGDKWRLELKPDFWEKRAQFDAVLGNLVSGIADGRFFILPGDACAWCEFQTMCRKSHAPTRRRAENDPAARRWIDFAPTLYEKQKE